MSIKNEIIKLFQKEQSPFLILDDLYKAFPLYQKSSIRSALSRGKKAGIFDSPDKGVYFHDYEVEWKIYRHSKHIYDSHGEDVQREFDIDVEISCEGAAPTNLTMEQIDRIVNPKLLTRAVEIMQTQGIYLQEKDLDYNVMGSEWKDAVKEPSINEWDVEIRMINNLGSHYTFKGELYVRASEWQ